MATARGAAKRRRDARRRRRLRALLLKERELWSKGLLAVCGVDEAGVGPLAGPVVAAAAVFAPETYVAGVDDSKTLTPEERARLAEEIRDTASAWAVAVADIEEIDRINIYRATLQAMKRAVLSLDAQPEHVLVDARAIPDLTMPQESIVKGDARCHAIAAASILAKTHRDALMARYDLEFPGYGFADHKGYCTRAHRDAIKRLGPCPIHRRSFTLVPPPTLWDAFPHAFE